MQEVQLKDAFTDISCAAAETELEACRSVLGANMVLSDRLCLLERLELHSK